MHESTCSAPRCHQPCPDGYLCKTCTDTARGHLLELSGHPAPPREGPQRDADGRPHDRGLLLDLATLMAREDVADPDTARPAELPDPDDVPLPTDEPIAAHPMPVHLGAGRALGEAHQDLRRWVKAIVETRHGRDLERDARTVAVERIRRAEALLLTPRVNGAHLNGYLADRPRRPRLVQLPDGRNPRELALWLARHLHDLRQHPDAGRIAADLARHVDRAESIVSGRDVEYLGLCSECWDNQAEAYLYADRGAPQVTCPKCGCTYDVPELREWLLRQARDLWLPAPEVDRALVDHVRSVRRTHNLTERDLPWNADVVRGMGRHGRVERRDPTKAERETGARTQARYRVGEVMDLVAETAEKKRAAIDRRGARAS